MSVPKHSHRAAASVLAVMASASAAPEPRVCSSAQKRRPGWALSAHAALLVEVLRQLLNLAQHTPDT